MINLILISNKSLIIKMKTGGVALLIVSFLALIGNIRCQLQTCQNPQYIIPYQPIDNAFDSGINYIRGQDQLVALIQNPNANTAKDYLLSLAPFAAPLFSLALVTFIIFIASIVQVICFNSCGKECCGNQMKSDTYNICCFRTMVAAFLILSFFIIAIAIASLIFNSDLQRAIDFTSCNSQNIVYQTYNGNNNNTIPWSGVNNFQSDVDVFAVNIQNNVPFLISYFSNTNPSYNQIVDQTTGSSYSNAKTFNCQNSNTQISCPFPSSVQTCQTPYQATFNAQFCNNTFNGSAANLINNEMTKNSTVWMNNTMNIATTLTTLNTNSQNVQNLVNSITNFTTSVGQYQTSLESGFNKTDQIQNSLEIAFYVFYSVILASAVLGMVTLCMVYFCNAFKCRCFMYVFWYLNFLLALLLFINSGFFLSSSIFTYDTCLAYPYYFKNQTNFNKLTFNNSQAGSIFATCFFASSSSSMFNAFTNTSILTQFGTLYSQYQSAMPNPQFSTVVSQIQNTLVNYAANPNTVQIQNVPSSQQPSMALSQMNTFANFSAPSSSQSCRLTKDYFTYDVINCGSYLVNQPIGNNSCMVMFASNINTIVSSRVTAFNNQNCITDGTNYQNRVNALIQYGNNIASIALSLAPVQQSSTPLQNYQSAYFTYYSNVRNFYNIDVQNIFNGFFNPYNSLYSGSSCGFVTASMDGIVNIACNQLQPYINSFSALNIACSVFMFFLFLLSYFLTTRLEFYEYLQGNFANFGVQSITTKDLTRTYELDSANSKNVQLLQIGNQSL